MITFLKSLFTRRPIVVNNYKVNKSDWRKLHEAKLEQMAKELGRDWTVR